MSPIVKLKYLQLLLVFSSLFLLPPLGPLLRPQYLPSSDPRLQNLCFHPEACITALRLTCSGRDIEHSAMNASRPRLPFNATLPCVHSDSRVWKVYQIVPLKGLICLQKAR